MDDKKERQRKAHKKFNENHPDYRVKYSFVEVMDYEIIEAKIDDLRHK